MYITWLGPPSAKAAAMLDREDEEEDVADGILHIDPLDPTWSCIADGSFNADGSSGMLSKNLTESWEDRPIDDDLLRMPLLSGDGDLLSKAISDDC
jgi:hypothetical protein